MTRAERKAKRNALFALQDAQRKAVEVQKQQEELTRQRWASSHPISSGLIPVVNYTPPK